MSRPLSRGIVVFPLVLALGGHLLLLQTVAWAGMILRYSRDASLYTALEKTFDGQHPCPLCKQVQKSRSQECQSERQSGPPARIDLGLPLTRLRAPAPPSPTPPFPGKPNTFASRLLDAPPTPPPKTA